MRAPETRERLCTWHQGRCRPLLGEKLRGIGVFSDRGHLRVRWAPAIRKVPSRRVATGYGSLGTPTRARWQRRGDAFSAIPVARRESCRASIPLCRGFPRDPASLRSQTLPNPATGHTHTPPATMGHDNDLSENAAIFPSNPCAACMHTQPKWLSRLDFQRTTLFALRNGQSFVPRYGDTRSLPLCCCLCKVNRGV